MKTPALILALALSPLLRAKPTDAEIEFFESKIRPVLAESCYECHNSIDKSKGDIALDYRQALLDSEIIVPGKPEESPLILAIRHDEDYEAMPSKSPKLSNLTIKHFEDWIRMGAPDPRDQKPTKEDLESQVNWDSVRDQRARWWSFQPIANPTPPEAANPEWNQTAIDKFIFAKMTAAGLAPGPQTSPENLIRRLHLILIGQPPSPEIVATYSENPTQSAYHKIVDDILASPRFGERWGRYWLDWFRYAETHGSEGDPAIPYASEYRDYIIRALNSDVPYNQLLHEHLAGDLLEKPRINPELEINESAIGTAHLRMVPLGFGVTDAYQEQITFTDNQVDALTKATLGLTVSCARCHNHKFDPISQADFYKFYGVMISSRHGTVNIDSPELKRKHRAELTALKTSIKDDLAIHWQTQLDQALEKFETFQSDEIRKQEHHPLHAWLHLRDHNDPAAEWQRLTKAHENRLTQKKEAIANATFYADLREQDHYDRWFKNGTGLTPQVAPAGSFAVAPEGDHALTGIYPRGIYTHLLSSKDNATLGSIFHKAKGNHASVHAIGQNATARFSPRSYPLAHGLLHPASGLKENFSWVNLGKYPYWNQEQVYFQLTTGPDQTYQNSPGRAWFGVTEVFASEHRFPDIGHPALAFKTPSIENRNDLLAFYRQQIQNALTRWQADTLEDPHAALLESFRKHNFLSDQLAVLPAPLQEKINNYRSLESALTIPRRAPGLLEAQPWDQPLLIRGSQKEESDPVVRGFLEVFGGRTYPKENSGRLELAHDLTDPANTLTSRVLVNRLWHHTFGQGLVTSTDNFGRLGKQPSHPELLDHLATRFKNEGWSIKKTLREFVTSRTFVSSSEVSSLNREKDPANLHLSHFNPRRLDAEAIQDSMSFLSGSNAKPAIYTPVIRNNLDPFLVAFNAPIPTTSVGTRDDTNVPAQSLMLLNGDLTRRNAESWARKIERNPDLNAPASQINRLFLEAYSRPPTTDELAVCLAFLQAPADSSTLDTLATKTREAATHLEQLQTSRHQLTAPTRATLEALAKSQQDDKEPLDLKPIAHWDFKNHTQDTIGNLHGTLRGKASLQDHALLLEGGALFTKPIETNLTERSFEILLQLDTLTQKGGGAFTLQTIDGNVFDSIVWSELTSRRWLSGSEFHRRTSPFETPNDDLADKEPIRLIYTYQKDGTIHAYRNGKLLGKPIRKAPPVTFQAGKAQVIFGLRHGTNPGGGRSLTGRIFEARLYDRALTKEEVIAANTGRMIYILRDDDILAALPENTRSEVLALDQKIATATEAANKLSVELQTKTEALSRSPKGLARLTHALLNSKELIYVH